MLHYSEPGVAGCRVVVAPNVLEVHYEEPIERLWPDFKGRMAGQGFGSVQALKDRVAELLRGYRPQEIQSLTGSAYILEAVNGLVL